MKNGVAKVKESGRNSLLEECERLRQDCNKMTDAERRRARQQALKIIYGTDANKSAGRR